MSNQLAIRDDISLSELGKVLVQSKYFADTTEAAQAIVKVLAGREIGFGPVASMTGFNIIKGRVSMSANLMAAAIKRTGKYNYRVAELSEKRCEIVFFEGGQEIGRSIFTADDARKAGTQNMDKFPRNMLFARAISNGAKWYCADIFGGPIYTPDELGADVNEDGEVIDAPSTISASVVIQPPAEKADAATWQKWYRMAEKADAAGIILPEPPETIAQAELTQLIKSRFAELPENVQAELKQKD